jgi:hypothetical protein
MFVKGHWEIAGCLGWYLGQKKQQVSRFENGNGLNMVDLL